MRSQNLISAAMVLLLAVLISCTPQNTNPLEGVWKLESASYTTPDTTTTVSGEDWNQIKILTESHFAFLGQGTDREDFTEGGTDSELLAAVQSFQAGGGTYTVDGDTYTEHIDYFLTPNVAGVSLEFNYEMDGEDRWIQTGTLPMSELGLQQYDTELREVWVRVE